MDTASFAAPARVCALVVPAGLVTVDQFHRHYQRLCEAAVVPLIDVHLPRRAELGSDQENKLHSTSDSSTDTFDPRANPAGSLTFSFETAPLPASATALTDLEPWRQQFLALGVTKYDPKVSAADREGTLNQLREKFPKSIYHVVLVFDTDDQVARNCETKGGIHYISQTRITDLDSAMSTIAGEFLAHMSTFWTVRQLSSFKSPSEISCDTRESTPEVRGHHRLTHSTSTASSPAHQRSPSATVLGKHGSISMTSAERAKSRQDGRTHKYLGNLYLLTGRIGDALSELGLAATILREHDDHLWTANALNDIGLCLVLQKWRGERSGVPSIAVSLAWSAALRALKNKKRAPPTVHAATSAMGSTLGRRDSSVSFGSESISESSNQPPSSTSSSPRNSITLTRVLSVKKNRPFTDQTPVEELLEFLITGALDEYNSAYTTEPLLYTVYCESVVRYVSLLISLRYGHGWTELALDTALGGHELGPSTVAPGDYPTILDLESWISRVYTLNLHHLEPDTHAMILGSVAQLYARAGLRRKWAFTCSRVVNLLASSRATINTDLSQTAEVLRVYATWPRLEAEVLRKLIPLGQRLHNSDLQTEAASHLLAMVCRQELKMMDKEQLTLYHVIRSLSDSTQAPFWDEELVLSVKVKSHRLTTVSSRSRKPRAGTIEDDVLIYNPFDEVETKEIGSVEAGVPTTAKIFLRNPLAIELQIFELALVDKEGNRISETAKNINLPANVTHFKIETVFTPSLNQSEVLISHCYVQVSGCAGQTYSVPEITIPIIPARPVLVLQELSLQKGWTMLLEGEQKPFSITLWNSSDTPNKIMHFGFNDSTVDSLRSAAARQDVTRAEFYEYEYFLHKRRAIDLVTNTSSVTNENTREPSTDDYDSEILPQASRTYNFRITGKRGVNTAAVLVDYGLTKDTLRRLKIPLQVTIYPSIGIDRASVLPSPAKNCVLLVLDLRNLWRESLTCKVWAEQSPVQTQRLEPTNVRRVLIEVPWTPLSPEELARPIPTLSKRQYTVDTKTHPEQIELFWLREKLLSCLHGEWFTDQGRHGYIELRTVQITKKMAVVLKKSLVEVSAKLKTSSLEVDQPLDVVVTVVNESAVSLQGMLRLVANKPAQRYMLVLGNSQELVTLEPGGSASVTFSVVFLNRGPFELTSLLDLVDGLSVVEPIMQAEPIKIVV